MSYKQIFKIQILKKKMETLKIQEKIKNLMKIWILFFLLSSVAFFIKHGGDELMVVLTIFPVLSFFIFLFDYVIFD